MILNLLKRLIDIRIVLIVSFLVRMLYAGVLYYKNGTTEFCDDWDYINYAKDLLSQGWMLPHLNEESQIVGPGWPLIIAPLIAIFGDNYWPVVILNVLLSTAQVYVIYLLGIQIFRNKTIGILAAAWACFYVPFFNYAPFAIKENFNQFLMAFCLLWFIRLSEEKKPLSKSLLIFVLSYSLFIHGDERYFFYLPLLFLGLLLIGPDKKLNFQKTLLTGLFLLMSMIPWLYRNYQFYGRPVILTIRTAPFTDKIFGYKTEDKTDGVTPYNPKNIPVFQMIADSLKAGKMINVPGVKSNYENSLKEAIESGIDVQPYSRTRHYWEEFKELWRPVRFRAGMVAYGYRYEKPWFWYSNLIYGLSFGLLLPFMIVGLIRMFRNRDRHFWILFLILLFHTLLHVFVAHVRTRYRYPVDFIVILTAIYGMYQIYLIYFARPETKNLS